MPFSTITPVGFNTARPGGWRAACNFLCTGLETVVHAMDRDNFGSRFIAVKFQLSIQILMVGDGIYAMNHGDQANERTILFHSQQRSTKLQTKTEKQNKLINKQLAVMSRK